MGIIFINFNCKIMEWCDVMYQYLLKGNYFCFYKSFILSYI